jgi:hypothetical protein
VLLLLLLLLAVVSDAGSGGQVLLDSTSFGLLKDRLEELGQVRCCCCCCCWRCCCGSCERMDGTPSSCITHTIYYA